MTDFTLTEEQADLLESAERFCAERSPPEVVRRLMATERGYDIDVWEEIVGLGWLGIAVPEAHGGAGLGLAEVVPVAEQMGRRLLATPFDACTLAAQAILYGGTEAQAAALLPRLVGGEVMACALAEAGGVWNFSAPEAKARREGDGFILSGEKRFVPHADEATVLIVSARLDGAVVLLTVPRDAVPDGAITRDAVIDETKRSFTVRLDGVRVGEDTLMAPGRALAALDRLTLAGALLSAARGVGGTRAVIDLTTDYLRTRKQFGRLIGSFQALKHPVVDAFLAGETARSHLYGAAAAWGQQGSAEVATRMARASADAALSHAADRSIQFHGGFGFTYDCDAQLYRRAGVWEASQHGDAGSHRAALADLLL